MWSNDIKYKYMFPQKNLACKGLIIAIYNFRDVVPDIKCRLHFGSIIKCKYMCTYMLGNMENSLRNV